MKRHILSHILVVITLSAALTSCENEVDLFTDPEDIAVVYGTLSQLDSVQYIRINPVFIGDEDAQTLAQDLDLINYPDVLDVSLRDMDSDVEYPLVRTVNEIPMEEGFFNNEENVLYKLETPVEISGITGKADNSVLDPEHKYELNIYNRDSQRSFKGETALIDANTQGISKPRRQNVNGIGFAVDGNYQTYVFEFNAVENARRYEMHMRYNYREVYNQTDTSDFMYVEMKIGEKVLSNAEIGSSVQIEYNGEDFYRTLANVLEPGSADLQRLGYKIDLILTAMGKELDAYINVSKPLTSVSQVRPEYTNIENGLGVLSCRNIQVFPAYRLNNPSSIVLRTGDHTRDLNFCTLVIGSETAMDCRK